MDRFRELFEDTLESHFDFDQLVVNIGSHPSNDIVISGKDILPFHASLILSGDEYRLIPLSPDSVIYLEDIPFTETVVCVAEDQDVRIGSYQMRFSLNGSPTTMHVTLSHPPEENEPSNDIPEPVLHPDLALDAQPEIVSDQPYRPVEKLEDAILVNLLTQNDEIDVEQSALFVYDVVNIGVIVEHFLVTVKGLPDSWVSVSSPKIQLMKGERTSLHINLTPPRASSSSAGRHSFQVVFTSPNYPDQFFTVEKEFTIRPFTRFSVGSFSPQKLTIPWKKHKGTVIVPITNHGNSPTDFFVTAADEENGCSFEFDVGDGNKLFRQAMVQVPAGDSIKLPVEISPRKQPVLALKNHSYLFTTTIQVSDPAVPTQMVSGNVTYRPLFGLLTMLLVIMMALGGLLYLLQPRIYDFQLANGKDVIELGDTTRLEWSTAPFATTLNISNFDKAINRGQTSLTIAPAESTTYELVASNWLSDLLGFTYKKSQTVLVIPPSPKINVFDVDQTSVAKGKPVNLRWSITQADQVFLTIDDVIYELAKEEFSGERLVTLEKDALVILEARNASGSELRSYYINVVAPLINVRAFTVWVRPPGVEAYTPGPAKLAAAVYAPDPNFPEKFVELVPDNASDSGYRVEFYQPERELQKGEQIILDWYVEGTDSDKIQIAPYTDPLPAKGSQPFFPQESMNFVMTAKSGELEQLFMLPVKVFDGIPPEAPKIEFFKASPVKMQGEGNVELAWSVSGEWTRVQIASGEQIVADYINPQGFKTILVSKSSTYILTAWNGDLSSAAPVEITVDPALKPIGLEISTVYGEGGINELMVGGKASITVRFFENPGDPLSPKPDPEPTGEVLVSDGVSTCTIKLPAISCELTFTTPNDPKELKATYYGDSVYLQATSEVNTDIKVFSATVNLAPVYYRLVKPGNTRDINSIANITNEQFAMDSGLYIEVLVTPVSTLLPVDDKGKINVSVCKQAGSKKEIVPGSCQFVSAATVKVNGPTQGQADIILPNFPESGNLVLLLTYRHDENALDPAQFTQYGLTISKMGIYLSLSTCTDPINFINCEVGITNPADAKIVFDIKRKVGGGALAAPLPQPEANAFDMFEVNASGGRVANWSCEVILATQQGTSVYKLECTANLTNKSNVRINYDFNNSTSKNYFMGTSPTVDFNRSPFNLIVKSTSTVTFDTQTNYIVGQEVVLTSPTGGAITVNANGTPVTNSTGMLSLTSTESGLLGLVPGSTCSLINNGTEVTNISIRSICSVYFRKQGKWDLTIAFTGDGNLSPSSTNVAQLQVDLQNGLSLNWQYNSGGGYKNWDIVQTKNSNLPIRLVVDGPSGFSRKSLEGEKLAVTLNILQNTTPPGACVLVGSAVLGSFPGYQVSIQYNQIDDKSYADFSLNCSTKVMEVSVDVQLADLTNFNLSSGQITSHTIVFTDRTLANMTVSVKRSADGHQEISLNPDKVGMLFVGESYDVQVEIGPLYADALNRTYYPWIKPGAPTSIQEAINRYLYPNWPATNVFRTVKIDLPPEMVSFVDWSRSTCRSSQGANDLMVPLNGYKVLSNYGYSVSGYGIHDIALYNTSPCKLVFIKDGSSADEITKFTFPRVDDFTYPEQYYSDTKVYSASGLQKQTVSYTLDVPFDTLGRVNDPPQTVKMTLSNPIIGSTLLPLTTTTFDDWFNFTIPTCTGLSLTGSISGQVVTFILQPPSVLCSGQLEIQYKSNNGWFGTKLLINETLNFANPPATQTTLSSTPSASPSKFGQQVVLRASVGLVSGSGTPTGSVEFWDGTSLLGTRSLSGGIADFTAANLALGSHSFFAKYLPTGNSFGDSSSSPRTWTVEAAASTTTVQSNRNPSMLGESVTFTASVVAQAPGGGIPTGTVQFKDGSANLGSPVSLNSSGTAAYTASALTSGSHTVTAVFTPANGNYLGSTSTGLNQVVNLATSTSVTSNKMPGNQSTYGESVTFTAIVSVNAPGSGIPTGSVQFMDGAGNLGSPISLVNGQASFTTSSLNIGAHTIKAVYLVDPGFTSSQAELVHTVVSVTTTTTLSVSPATAQEGDAVTFTATVLSSTGAVAVGSVQYWDNNTQLGSQSLSNGVAVFQTTTLSKGKHHNLTAVFVPGNSNFQASTSSKQSVDIN